MFYPADRYLNQTIRTTLYMLKRQYGGRVDVYASTGSSVNYRTGEKTIGREVIPVTRAVILPGNLERSVVQSISAISANKKFVSGGYFDSGSRRFIFDAKDLPQGFRFTQHHWLVYKSRHYEVGNIQEFEFDAGWIVTGKEVFDRTPQQTFTLRADNLISLADEVDQTDV